MATEKKLHVQDNEENGELESVDLDGILVRELGQFGRYQLKNMALCVLLVIFVAWAASEYVFTTARIPSRCFIPECDGETPVYSPPWILTAVPGGGGSITACQRFAPTGDVAEDAGAGQGTCPAELFDNMTVVNCESNVYQNTHSVAYDYDLGCEEWRRSLIGTIRTLGTFTALPITGYVSDRWGRRVALTITAVNTAWLGLVRYWAGTYLGFMLSEFIEATLGSGGFSCAYILVMELVGPKYRVAAGAAMNTCFALGQVTMGLLAWAVPNWRNLTLVLYVPQLLTLSYFWLINESVRWLMSKGRYEEAEEILKKVADVNGRQLSERSLQSLRRSAEDEKKRAEQASLERQEWLPLVVWRHKRVLLRCCVAPVWWVTTTFVYYGLSLNAMNMSGNRYVNYVAVSAVEIPGYWTAVYLLHAVGRKLVLTGAFWTCATCQIIYIFLPSGYYGASLAVYLVGKYAIAIVMTSIYVYTAELYPTQNRHSLFAFSSMIGRIGSMVAPLTPALGETVWSELPFVLFAVAALLSGALVLLTPETRARPLPNSMQEAEDLGKTMHQK